MSKKALTLNEWMLKNRWNNTALAKALTERGHGVAHSTISQIRNKTRGFVTSGRLAREIHYFTNKEVSLEEILSVE